MIYLVLKVPRNKNIKNSLVPLTGGRDVQEGGAIYIPRELVHFVAQWKLTRRSSYADLEKKENRSQREKR